MSGRKTATQLRAEGAERERAAVLALFYRQSAAVQALIANRKMDEAAGRLLCLRIDTMREQIEAGLHVPDSQGDQQYG